MTAITIERSRLTTLLETKELQRGAHLPNGTFCVMEAVAWLNKEPWSDKPECVSPVVAAFARNWNDSLGDVDRNRLLKPLLLDMVGTATTAEDEETRAWMATDWFARVYTPAWLRLAGLTKEAQALESCARIVDAITASAWDAAWDALAPTVLALQTSAVELLQAMCAVGRREVVVIDSVRAARGDGE